MAATVLDGKQLKDLFAGGLANLRLNASAIDDLNVFPIPDGDTGSNMLMTLEGAVKSAFSEESGDASAFAKKFSRGALLGARGNSGVILSQFIRGFSNGCEGKQALNVRDFTDAFKMGVDRAYEAVITPTEGTILTVMREGWEYISREGKNITNYHDYFDRLCRSMDESLAHTPELLPILKESGVIDSGGAGFICIFRGMEMVLNGEKIDAAADFSMNAESSNIIDPSVFNADSELVYGYCTEFILQLQNKKTDIKNFDINEIVSYLETIGNSIVAVQDDDLVKVHVHTFTPGEVLNFGQKYGEYITLKIENMSVQHNESSLFRKEETEPEKEYIPIAVCAVTSGPGLESYFRELGVNLCVDGGQTENPSTEDFIKAFETIEADDIIVLPCNSNIVMAASQAAELYTGANVHVVEAKTLAEGYSAISMMDVSCGDVDRIISEMNDAISGTATGLITNAIRDVDYESISVKKGHFIGMSRKQILSDSEDRLTAVKDLLNATEGIHEKEILVGFYGKNVPEEELEKLDLMISSEFGWMEYGFIDGGQDVYDYIFAIE